MGYEFIETFVEWTILSNWWRYAT